MYIAFKVSGLHSHNNDVLGSFGVHEISSMLEQPSAVSQTGLGNTSDSFLNGLFTSPSSLLDLILYHEVYFSVTSIAFQTF